MFRTLTAAADLNAGQTVTIAHGRCWPVDPECEGLPQGGKPCMKLHGVTTMAARAGNELAVEVGWVAFYATRTP